MCLSVHRRTVSVLDNTIDFSRRTAATPLGMRSDDPLPMDLDDVGVSTLVGEVVMAQDITPLLRVARTKGCAIQVGTDMLFEQIPMYLEFFGLGSAEPQELRALARLGQA